MAKLKKRADGLYQRKLTLSNGKQKFIYGRTLAELNEKEDLIRQDDRDGLRIGDKTTVSEWVDKWIDSYKSSDLKKSTIRMYRETSRKYISNTIGEMLIRDVKPVHCQKLMKQVEGMSYSLRCKVKLTLQQVFSSARKNGLIVQDPSENIKIKRSDSVKGKVEFLTEEQYTELLNNTNDEQAKLFVALCLYCGLRKSEALGLKWEDVTDGTVHVRRSVTFPDSNQADVDMTLKTPASKRDIPAPDKLIDILNGATKKGVYIIHREDGSLLSQNLYQDMLRKIQDACPVPFHAHMLRHTYCTMLYKAGIDVRKAQQLMGHSSITVTASIYTHLDSNDNSDAVKKLNSIF